MNLDHPFILLHCKAIGQAVTLDHIEGSLLGNDNGDEATYWNMVATLLIKATNQAIDMRQKALSKIGPAQ